MIRTRKGYRYVIGDIDEVIIDGDIMPVRDGTITQVDVYGVEHNTSRKKLLRGEDVCYLKEWVLTLMHQANAYHGIPDIFSKVVSAAQLHELAEVVRWIYTKPEGRIFTGGDGVIYPIYAYGYGQQAYYNLSGTSEPPSDIFRNFPARQSNPDDFVSGNQLRAEDVEKLFTDLRNVNELWVPSSNIMHDAPLQGWSKSWSGSLWPEVDVHTLESLYPGIFFYYKMENWNGTTWWQTNTCGATRCEPAQGYNIANISFTAPYDRFTSFILEDFVEVVNIIDGVEVGRRYCLLPVTPTTSFTTMTATGSILGGVTVDTILANCNIQVLPPPARSQTKTGPWSQEIIVKRTNMGAWLPFIDLFRW